jgi:hypothetical protein
MFKQQTHIELSILTKFDLNISINMPRQVTMFKY